MSQTSSTPALAFMLAGIGLIGFVLFIALDRLLGVQFGNPGIFLWLFVVSILPAAGIALLFHGAAIDRAGPPSANANKKEFRP